MTGLCTYQFPEEKEDGLTALKRLRIEHDFGDEYWYENEITCLIYTDRDYFERPNFRGEPEDYTKLFEALTDDDISVEDFLANLSNYNYCCEKALKRTQNDPFHVHLLSKIKGERFDFLWSMIRFHWCKKEPVLNLDCTQKKVLRLYRNYWLENKSCDVIDQLTPEELQFAKDHPETESLLLNYVSCRISPVDFGLVCVKTDTLKIEESLRQLMLRRIISKSFYKEIDLALQRVKLNGLQHMIIRDCKFVSSFSHDQIYAEKLAIFVSANCTKSSEETFNKIVCSELEDNLLSKLDKNIKYKYPSYDASLKLPGKTEKTLSKSAEQTMFLLNGYFNTFVVHALSPDKKNGFMSIDFFKLEMYMDRDEENCQKLHDQIGYRYISDSQFRKILKNFCSKERLGMYFNEAYFFTLVKICEPESKVELIQTLISLQQGKEYGNTGLRSRARRIALCFVYFLNNSDSCKVHEQLMDSEQALVERYPGINVLYNNFLSCKNGYEEFQKDCLNCMDVLVENLLEVSIAMFSRILCMTLKTFFMMKLETFIFDKITENKLLAFEELLIETWSNVSQLLHDVIYMNKIIVMLTTIINEKIIKKPN